MKNRQVGPSHKIDIDHLHLKVKNFRAGNIRHYINKWMDITSDGYILDIVQNGLKLNFSAKAPEKGSFEYKRARNETKVIDEEVERLLEKQVISACGEKTGDYFSSLFTREKKNGSYRTILNLKYLNEECKTHHFKMESLKQAIHMIRPGAYLASIDIKDAFYSVPIHPSHKKYLKFMWKAKPYQFEAMPNGYLDAMRIFAKLMKPVFSTLRKMGFVSILYVDDTLLYGDTFAECKENVRATLEMLQDLGFIVHSEKSVFEPTQHIVFLGFEFDTVAMTITLTKEKKNKILKLANDILRKDQVSIRYVSKFLGNLTSSFDGVPLGKMYYRHIEFDKTVSLKLAKGDYEAMCFLSIEALNEIAWWIENIPTAFGRIKTTPGIDYVIHTDASNEGWGASDGVYPDINGRWTLGEQMLHINALELKAIKLALHSYLPLNEDAKHIRIKSDNTTAISYINKKGGTHNMTLNDMAVDIWEYCIDMGMHISAAHIPGVHNVLADTASREFIDSAEWAIPHKYFNKITRRFGIPEIDLFASRLNNKLPTYASWKPDPQSSAIDAMSIPWSNKFIYLFPPFSMMWPILSKIEEDRVLKAIIVIPDWSTQSWYPRLQKKLLLQPMRIPSTCLYLPGTKKTHPLAPKLKLLAVLCSWQDKTYL